MKLLRCGVMVDVETWPICAELEECELQLCCASEH